MNGGTARHRPSTRGVRRHAGQRRHWHQGAGHHRYAANARSAAARCPVSMTLLRSMAETLRLSGFSLVSGPVSPYVCAAPSPKSGSYADP
jgi:hypothetical protein